MSELYTYSSKIFFYKTAYIEIKADRPLAATSAQIKLFPVNIENTKHGPPIVHWYKSYHKEINYFFQSLVKFYIIHKIHFNDNLDNIYNAFVELLYVQYTNKL
jgi:hypothetical protein